MRRASPAIVLACAAVVGAVAFVAAQQPTEVPKDSPSWAYGVPPLAAPRAGQPGARRGGGPGARRGGGPGVRRQPDTAVKHVPGSSGAFTMAQLRNFFDVPDWFPNEHEPAPNVVLHGRAPHVRACGMCHTPEGFGRPENAPIAGLPYTYILQQLSDFKHDLRTSADPRKTNTQQMIEGAKDMTDDEIEAAATYISSLKWRPWVRVVESATVPQMRLAGNVFLPVEGGGTEPIGNRIIETPEDVPLFELRDPHSGFIAYAPPGSVEKGAALVAGGGGGKTFECRTCHGADLNGLGPVPGIAGRGPSYLMRQLFDFQKGTRRGPWSPLMEQVVKNLTQQDMVDIVAYVASQSPVRK